MKKGDGKVVCGWCMTGHHDTCKPEVKYFDKVWYCGCITCHPESGVEEKEGKTDELVEEPIQEQEA
jgi:hypothetical protein